MAIMIEKKKKINKSLLIFAHYSEGYIPKQVEEYIQELSRHVDDVVLSTNYTGFYDLPYPLFSTPNEGYDFGFFYKVLKRVKNKNYDRIIFANDSNTLVGKFDKIFNWSLENKMDVWGLTDSSECWLTDPTPGKVLKKCKETDHNHYHLQTHFIVFEKRSIPHLYTFFDDIKFEKNFLYPVKPAENLRRKVITSCEFGLAQYMQSRGLSAGARWSVKHWKHMKGKEINMHFSKWEELIKDGYPLMKNKIVNGEWDDPQEGVEGWPALPNSQNKWKYYKNE